MNINVHI